MLQKWSWHLLNNNFEDRYLEQGSVLNNEFVATVGLNQIV